MLLLRHWLVYILIGGFIIYFVSTPVASEQSSTRFTKWPPSLDLPTYSKILSTQRSKLECALQCSVGQECLAFYFNQTQNQCILAITDHVLNNTLVYSVWLYYRDLSDTVTLFTNSDPVNITTSGNIIIPTTTTDYHNNAPTELTNISSDLITEEHNNYTHSITTSNINSGLPIKNTLRNHLNIVNPTYDEQTITSTTNIEQTTKYTTTEESSGYMSSETTDSDRQAGIKNTTSSNNSDQSDYDGDFENRPPGCSNMFKTLNKCIIFHLNDIATWRDAYDICHRNNGKLLDFRSKEEFLTFRKIIKKYNMFDHRSFHLGLGRYNGEQTWKWINTGVPVFVADDIWADNQLFWGGRASGDVNIGTQQSDHTPSRSSGRISRDTNWSFSSDDGASRSGYDSPNVSMVHYGSQQSNREDSNVNQQTFPSQCGYFMAKDEYKISTDWCLSPNQRSYTCQY